MSSGGRRANATGLNSPVQERKGYIVKFPPCHACLIGYSDFNNLMGFTSKKLPYIILNNVYKKSFFKRIGHFMRVCIIRFKNSGQRFINSRGLQSTT
jgi:hypothetical protein